LNPERRDWFRWRRLFSLLVVALIFYFLGRELFRNYEQLSTYQWQIRCPFFIASFLILFLNFFLEAWIWKKLLEIFDIRISVSKSFKIINLSQMGKYIPGKFWIYLGQFYLGGKEGISKKIILMSNFFFLVLLTTGGITVFGISYPLWPEVNRSLVIGLWSLVAFLLLVLHPWPLRRVAGIIRKWVEVPVGHYSFLKVVFFFLLVVFDWMIYFIAFHIFLLSFYAVTLRESLLYMGIFAVSGLLGLYSLITPGGLGVREGVQTYLMSQFVPISIAVVISILSRIWMTSAEVGAALLALRVKR